MNIRTRGIHSSVVKIVARTRSHPGKRYGPVVYVVNASGRATNPKDARNASKGDMLRTSPVASDKDLAARHGAEYSRFSLIILLYIVINIEVQRAVKRII